MVIARHRQIDLAFSALVRLAVVAMTPAIIAGTVIPLVLSIELEGCLWWILSGLISSAYLVFAISANRWPATAPGTGGFVAVAGDRRTQLISVGLAGLLLVLGIRSVTESFSQKNVERVFHADSDTARQRAREILARGFPRTANRDDPAAAPRTTMGPRDYLSEVRRHLEPSGWAPGNESGRPLQSHELELVRGATVLVRTNQGSGSGFVFREAPRERMLVATNHHCHPHEHGSPVLFDRRDAR